MTALGNDRFEAAFRPDDLGQWCYRVAGWVDRFGTWRKATRIKLAAGLEIDLELLEGADLIAPLDGGLAGESAAIVSAATRAWRSGRTGPWLDDERLVTIVRDHLDRTPESSSGDLPVTVEVPLAGFSAWYEFFPRSHTTEDDRGTLVAAVDRLDYIAALGFDVVYLPPIHPIGTSFRKGRNNNVTAAPGAPAREWPSPSTSPSKPHPTIPG
jgi:starch synthase (maltosyl-transferring)